VNDLYKENYKPLNKEFKESYKRWKDLPCSWIGRINIVKMAILLKEMYIFNAIPTKIPMAFIPETEISTLKYILKYKRPQIAKAILNKKEQHWKYHNTLLQTILQSHSNKISMVLAQKQIGSVEQNRRPRYEFMQLCPLQILDKGARNIQWRKDSLFNKCCWENWVSSCR
jgi:hypothetical protein